MTQEKEILKIEIPVEEETPFVPESGRARPDVKGKAAQAGKTAVKTVGKTAKKAWDSEPRRKVTRSVAKGTATVAAKSGRFVSEKVAQAAERQARERAAAAQTRLRETDWKAEAKGGAARSLQWLSRKFSELAARMNAPAKAENEANETSSDN
ncbi:MAG: hypothetical protein GY803_12150 [Chloroflexi bacterium]|nr:hypothetical protein [Chloroflexota bacterium]